MRLIAQASLAVALLGIPWFFGGVLPKHVFWFFAAVLVSLACCVPLQCTGSRTAVGRLPAAALPLGLAICLGGLQLMPLPSALLQFVAPRTDVLWQNAVTQTTAPGDAAGTGSWRFASARPTLSLYPAATRRDLALLILACAIFLLGGWLFSNRQQPVGLFVLLTVLGSAMAFFGIAQQLTWNGELYGSVPLTQGGHPFAAFVNKNNAGGFLNLCLAGAIAFTVWACARDESSDDPELGCSGGGKVPARQTDSQALMRSRDSARGATKGMAFGGVCLADLTTPKLAGATAIALITAGLLCAVSRGAWLSTIGAASVVLLVGGVTGQKRRSLLLLAAAALLGFALVGWVGRADRVRDRFETFRTGEAAKDSRLDHWQDGLRAAREFAVLGSGLGTYRYVYRLYERSTSDVWFHHAENQYLEALVVAGLVGLALVVAMITFVGHAVVRLLRRPVASVSYACGLAALFALVSQAIHALFDFGLYIPSNAALMAVICGVAVARAEKLAERHSSGRRRWRDRTGVRWLRVPPAPVLSFAGTLALALGVAWGAQQMRALASIERALADHPLPGSAERIDVGMIDHRLAQLTRQLSAVPGDAETHRRLARLLIHRYRVLTSVSLCDRFSDLTERESWELTAPLQIHGRICRLEREGRLEELQNSRHSDVVQDNLGRAVWHLQRARCESPLFADVHLLLAELEPAVSAHSARHKSVRAAQRVAGAAVNLHAECGLVELQAGRGMQALSAWRRCIELNGTLLPMFLKIALHNDELVAKAEFLIPDSLPLLLEAAGQLESTGQSGALQARLLRRAEDILDKGELPTAQRYFFRSRILALQGRVPQALAHCSRAVELNPREPHWRYELATLLKSQGRWAQARDQMRWCLRLDPNNARYQQVLREIIRAEVQSPTRNVVRSR